MKFAIEAYSEELVSEMLPLWKDHYRETHDEIYGKLDPDIGMYERLWENHSLKIYTVRDEAGRLHGYQIFFVSPDLHSVGFTQAVQDILYLCPDSRHGFVGYKFMKWCVEQLAGDVDSIHQRIPARNDFGAIFERMGFRLEDLVYSRRV